MHSSLPNLVFDVFGPTVEFLTSPSDDRLPYCVIRGTIPPGSAIPLHSHPDPESLFVVSGTAQVLTPRGDYLEWTDVAPGDFVHISGGAKHAHRNPSGAPVVQLVVMTRTLGRFFQEVGRPVTPGETLPPPDPEELARFRRIAATYGHWMGTAEENAEVGITGIT